MHTRVTYIFQMLTSANCIGDGDIGDGDTKVGKPKQWDTHKAQSADSIGEG